MEDRCFAFDMGVGLSGRPWCKRWISVHIFSSYPERSNKRTSNVARVVSIRLSMGQLNIGGMPLNSMC